MSISHEIIARIEARPMLSHPFYQAWTAGTLSKDALRAYAEQYFRHVDAFPRYVSSVHAGCDDLGVRKALLANLVEEEQGPDDHPTLWLRFAAALGASEADVRAAAAWPETTALVDAFFDLTKRGTWRQGLAALLAYESQVPGVARAKIDGLAKFYGIDAARDVQFFTAHLEADELHAATERDLLDRHATDAEREALLAAAERARDALWGFLDGALRASNAAAAA
ncbi:MAG TPA: CADD family putative folate metabolism protein [Byssovorax sp.]|jgi:pyrroloquinoline-quinone synthase